PRCFGRWLMSSSSRSSDCSHHVIVAPQEREDALRRLRLRIHRTERPGARQRIAGEEALVQHLAIAERAAGDVPGEAEQFHPVARAARVRREILLDMAAER